MFALRPRLEAGKTAGVNRRAQERRPKPAPSVGALRLILRSIAHDLHVAVWIVASFDPASVREPNEGRCR
jgi:hypothetical protein